MTYRLYWNLRKIKKYDEKSREKTFFIVLKKISKEYNLKKLLSLVYYIMQNNLLFCIDHSYI